MYRTQKIAPLLAVIGCLLLYRGATLAGLILLVIAASKLVQWQRDPRRKVHRAIASDARRYGVHVPGDHAVRAALEAVYVKYRKASQLYPALADTYAELIDSMWSELRATSSLTEWRRIVRTVAADWPMPWREGETPVAQSLRKAHHAARRWREAQREVTGQL